ncbi:hypothetical protein Q0M94_03110 [Deinococcus radiomollis]|uniref:DUF7079 family protein n=1 Tax=Deinococcus radiomollis TaxID=468916 RepID=UPI003891B961
MTAEPAAPFTLHQLGQRRSVWEALSELYLDTDTRPGLPRMAHALAESWLGEAELEAVWLEEVTPALAFNLSVVAGEWGYFDQDWLEERIVRRRGYRHLIRRWPPLTWLMTRVWPNEMQPSFRAVMALRGELLALPEARWPDRVAAWTWLAHAYFWSDSPTRAMPNTPALAALFTALEPHLRPLLTGKESAEASRTSVLRLLGIDA